MRILLVTDAWYPQMNGVVRTLDTVGALLRADGHEVGLVSPRGFRTLPCPTYPEIRLSLFPARRVAAIVDAMSPDSIHIATEGPLGLAARRHCLRRGLAFTTSFHTRFPEYVQARFRVPPEWLYAWLRRFHNASAGVMVATATLQRELDLRGFARLLPWSRGVDTTLFRPRAKDFLALPRPIWLYVGRVAVEKNIEAFLKLPLAGSKLVVGDAALGRNGKRAPAGAGEVVIEGARAGVADHVERAGNREGGDRQAGGECLEQDQTEGVGATREDEDVARRIVLR